MTKQEALSSAAQVFESAPYASLEAITQGGPLLVLAPHPDDESLGCGGLIAEACARGQHVRVVILTDGTGSHPNSRAWPPDRLKALREAEAQEAVAALGLAPEWLTFLGLRDRAAPHEGPEFETVAGEIAAVIRQARIRTVCTTWLHDPHPDHVAAHRLGAAATKATGARLLSYPIWGWMLPADPSMAPNGAGVFRLDIKDRLPQKRRALAAHRSQTSNLITDDPYGSRLPDELLAYFAQPYEVFLES
ncbi:MAG: PIG-L family deacetylase [Acetobacteraceae bacterium]|nr:PIG-L family deacetylase [Acetobacteraceae bacterium]